MQSILITPFIKDIQNNNSEMRQCPDESPNDFGKNH